MSSLFSGFSFSFKAFIPLCVHAVITRIPWLDKWNLLSSRSYNQLIEGKNLEMTGRDDKYVYARDISLRYIGPSSGSKVSPNASKVAIRRIYNIMNKANSYYANDLSASALFHNIIIRFYREFVPSSSALLRTCDLGVGDVFIDIGCFRGYLSLKASKIVGPKGRVYSIDPVVNSIEMLKKQIDLNDLENIHTLLRACVDESFNHRTVSFLDAGDGATRNSLIPDHLGASSIPIQVESISIKDILDQIPNTFLQNKRIVASITTNGTEFQLLKEIIRQCPVSITCCIPTLYTQGSIKRELSRFKAEFPNASIVDSYPWLQVRNEK